MNGLEQLLPFVLIFLAFWLLLIRPQRKRQQALQQAQGAVVVGDQVLLGSGIVGHIVEAGPEFLLLEISPGAHLTVARQAVVRTLTEPVETSFDDSYDDGRRRTRTARTLRRQHGVPDDRTDASDVDPHRPSAS